jgi:hypothetical protein
VQCALGDRAYVTAVTIAEDPTLSITYAAE